VKLCDFGWSAESHEQRYINLALFLIRNRVTFCGTIDYMAPEMIKNLPHDYRIDIWSLGILLYELLHGYAPFSGKNDKEKCRNIAQNAKINFDSSLSVEVCDLIQQILKPNPSDRLNMTEIFNHPWMKKYEDLFKIDIKSYVDQQDVEYREISILDDSRVETSPKNSLNDLNGSRRNRKGSQERERSRKNSVEKELKTKSSSIVNEEKLTSTTNRSSSELEEKIGSLINNLYLKSSKMKQI